MLCEVVFLLIEFLLIIILVGFYDMSQRTQSKLLKVLYILSQQFPYKDINSIIRSYGISDQVRQTFLQFFPFQL